MAAVKTKRSIEIALELDNKLTRGLTSAQRGIKRFGTRAKKEFDGVKKALFSMKGAFVGLAGVLGARALINGLQGVANELDEIVKTSQRIGVTVESLQELGHIARLAGTDLPPLTASLAVFSKNIEAARDGSLIMQKSMRDLGITFDDVKGKNLDIIKVLEKASIAWNDSESATKALNAAQQLFGRGGSKLGPIFAAGAAGIREQAEEARRLGGVLSRLDLDRAAEFNDAWLRVSTSLAAIFHQTFVDIAPELSKAFEDMKAAILDNRDALQKALTDMAKGFAEFVRFMAENITTLIRVWNAGVHTGSALVEIMTVGWLEAELAIKRFRGESEKELEAYKVAIVRTMRKAREETRLLNDVFKFDTGILPSTLGGRDAEGKARTAGERVAEAFGEGAESIKFAGVHSLEFEKIIRDIEDRRLTGIEAEERAIEKKYEKELKLIQERANLLGASDGQFARALKLLREERAAALRALTEGGDGASFFDGMATALGRIVDRLNDAGAAGAKFANDVAGAINSSVNREIDALIDGTKSLEDAWRDLGNTIANALTKILAKQLALNAAGFVMDAFRLGGSSSTTSTDPNLSFTGGGIGGDVAASSSGGGGVSVQTIPRTGSATTTSPVFNITNNISAIDSRNVAEFLDQNATQIVGLYDRALATNGSSRGAVRGAVA